VGDIGKTLGVTEFERTDAGDLVPEFTSADAETRIGEPAEVSAQAPAERAIASSGVEVR
jgi:hypothetical protein